MIHDVKLCEDEIELGYVISPEEQNRGYATEAVKAVIRELFYLGYAVIKAGAFSENAASIRVMEKCGMERTGETGTIAYRGEDHNCICYAIRYSSEVK